MIKDDKKIRPCDLCGGRMVILTPTPFSQVRNGVTYFRCEKCEQVKIKDN
jgi:rRNA maturation protein Nop10